MEMTSLVEGEVVNKISSTTASTDHNKNGGSEASKTSTGLQLQLTLAIITNTEESLYDEN